MNKKTKIIWKKIDDLIPYEHNTKEHGYEQVNDIATSIKKYGWQNPILIDRDNVIIAGHGRVLAAKQLKKKDCPCIYADDLTEQQVREYRILDNKLNESPWDNEALKFELPELNFDDFNFDFDLDFDLSGTNGDSNGVIEDEPPEEVETRCKTGDLWQLGNHRLICGDSTDVTVIDRLMDGVKADMVFTDPPYNVNYDEKEKRLLKYRPNARVKDDINTGIENDNIGDYETFCNNIAWIISQKTDGCVYVCGAQGKDGRTLFKAFDDKIHNSTTIIWNKPHFVLGDGKYQNKYEPIWFGWVKSGKSFTDDRTLTNVWDIDKPQKSELHPTMKPLELVATAIKHNSKSKSVLDLFGGSGSTLIACEQLNRKCYMAELDPHYCDVIIQRYEDFTGEKAVKIDG